MGSNTGFTLCVKQGGAVMSCNRREREREKEQERCHTHTLKPAASTACASYFSARPQKAAAQSTRCCMTDSRSVPLFTMCSSSHPDQAQFPGVGKAHGAWASAMQSSMSHWGLGYAHRCRGGRARTMIVPPTEVHCRAAEPARGPVKSPPSTGSHRMEMRIGRARPAAWASARERKVEPGPLS